ncbi:MAG: efflux RND transporter periplasmic adaptor subunit [Candidatus Acidiferrales bacterium]
MKKWQKIAIGVGLIVILGVVVLVSYNQANKDVVTVQTGKVARGDLVSVVSASGEVRPKEYTNVYAEGFGKITEIVAKEGDIVKRGDVLLKLESIQPGADVNAQEAAVGSSEAGLKSADANYQSAQATLVQRQADLEKAKNDWARTQQLYQQQLVAKSEFDASKATYDAAAAGVNAAKAQVEQTRAALDQSHSMLAQTRAVLVHQKDVLRKTTYTAPIDGLVTYIPVRVGETVVPGIQSALGSFLLTLSDMSVVTSEVMVDETDITNVRDGQPADVTIDALPGKIFVGHVTEVGDQAILRTSGQATTTQSTANTQEARDFKVVVTLDTALPGLRPGLSTTAKIRTAEEHSVLKIPIQALAIRTRKELHDAELQANGGSAGNVTLAASKSTDPLVDADKQEVQGVFVIRNNKAVFVPVETGIAGITDIEVKSGLKAGDQIVTGSYKALRTLRPNASVKVDNSAPKQDETSS